MDNHEPSIDEIRQSALTLLANREHSRSELRQKLIRKLDNPPALDQVLDSLEADGYLSDQRFAVSMTRARSRKGYGPLRVKAELAAKGVRGDTAEQVLEAEQADWVSLARQALRKKFGSAPAVDHASRAKHYRFLAQRGFSSDQIRIALDINSTDED